MREYRYVGCLVILLVLLTLMIVNQVYLSFGSYKETKQRRGYEYAQFGMLIILTAIIAFCMTPEAYFEIMKKK
jgi:hypothetical protein